MEFENGKVILSDINNHIVETNFQKETNLDYIKSLPGRKQEDLDKKHYDSVVTKLRTTLEEVLIHIIDNKGIEHDTNGDLGKLYKQCESVPGITIQNEWDKNVKTMLQGINNIVSSIAYKRNRGSDSHGVGDKRITITKREAKLISNSAIVVCEYLWDIYQSKKVK